MILKPTVLALAIAVTLAIGGCADRSTARPETVAPAKQSVGAAESAAEDKRENEVRQQPLATPMDDATRGRLSRAVAAAEVQRDDADQQAQGLVQQQPLESAPPATPSVAMVAPAPIAAPPASRTERYQDRVDNPIQITAENPVSTFSIDVDTGSYTNVRRMLASGELPPPDAVRAEEFLNYFDYGYTPPRDRSTPFSVTTEAAPAPWNAERTLLLVGIKGFEVPRSEIPASNLVFLIDTSGSMNEPAKLPLLIDAFKQLVPQLRAIDSVSIVVYAGSAGLVLEPTPGDQHARINAALNGLAAGGSTAGGAGIELAYAMARAAYIDGGVNRVILATDGDFNVGTTDTAALKSLVEDRRRSGIALSTLGFGAGNYNDELAEQLADVGNGNHAYIDTAREARKVLVEEMSSTLLTIASDVKVQVEFNPATVAEYRLIGYENRALRRADFNNDAVDAGEIGAGHDVTALYELTLTGSAARASDPLRYATDKSRPQRAAGELGFLKLRYKRPGEERSVLVEAPIARSLVQLDASPRLGFAASVVAFADHLRGATNMAGFDLAQVATLADDAVGADPGGQRREFVDLVRRAQSLQTPAPGRHLRIAD